MIKTYTITVNESEQTVSRTNTGFNTIELLGLLVMAKESIINQIKKQETFEDEFAEPVKPIKTKITRKK
jgi:hypothetical protein